MSDFGTMRARIADEIGDVDEAEFTTQIKRAIVDAIEHYQAERFWFLEDWDVQQSAITSVTADGTEFYAFPTSPKVIKLDTLRIKTSGTEAYDLIRQDWASIDHLATLASVFKADPTDYAVRGEYVRLYPIPDGVYTLYWTGIVQPTALTTSSEDADTNAWMTEGAQLIRNRAKMIVARDVLRDPELASLAGQAELEALARLRRETRRRLSGGRVKAHGWTSWH